MLWWHKFFGEKRKDEPSTPVNGADKSMSGADVVECLVSMSEMRVDALMVPRADIIAASLATEPRHILKRMRQHHVDIVPLYRDSLDHIVGCVRAWDLALLPEGAKTSSLIKHLEEPLYVVASAQVLDVFAEMRTRETPAAVVLDEYGGVDGFVTMADLMLAVSKEISRLRGAKQHWSWTEEKDDSFIIDARCPLDSFEKEATPLRQKGAYRDCDTVGGLVFALVGRVPERGEVIVYDKHWEFDILDVDMRRIRRVRLRRPHDKSPQKEGTSPQST